jgi:hypothetical protein
MLTPEEQAALDEQVARLEQYERTESEWLEVQTPEVQAAYALYVQDMSAGYPYASGESDTRHKEVGDG